MPVESRTSDFFPGTRASQSRAVVRLEARFNCPKPRLKRSWSRALAATGLSGVKLRIGSAVSL